MRFLHSSTAPFIAASFAFSLFATGCATTPSTGSTADDRSSETVVATTPAPTPASGGASSTTTATSEAPVAVVWVNGMGCPLCANNVDEQLLAVPGVTSVRVNLGLGHAVTELSPTNPPTESQLAAAIDRTGFTLVRIDMPR